MATYFFETITAAQALACAGNSDNLCFASDGADLGAGGGSSPELVEVTIIRGTVRTGGFDKATGSFDTEEHGPGDTVLVSPREAAGLIARGQAANPDAEPVPVGEGPMFTAPPVAPAAKPAPASPRGRKR